MSKKIISLMGILLSLVLVAAMAGCAAPAAPAGPTGPTEVKPVGISLISIDRMNDLNSAADAAGIDVLAVGVNLEVSNPNAEWVKVYDLVVEAKVADEGNPPGQVVIWGTVPTFYIPPNGEVMVMHRDVLQFGSLAGGFLTRGTADSLAGCIGVRNVFWDALKADDAAVDFSASASVTMPEYPDLATARVSFSSTWTMPKHPLED